MTQYNFEEFQELVEQFEPEMSLKSICEQEGVRMLSGSSGASVVLLYTFPR